LSGRSCRPSPYTAKGGVVGAVVPSVTLHRKGWGCRGGRAVRHPTPQRVGLSGRSCRPSPYTAKGGVVGAVVPSVTFGLIQRQKETAEVGRRSVSGRGRLSGLSLLFGGRGGGKSYLDRFRLYRFHTVADGVGTDSKIGRYCLISISTLTEF